jgi:hypothetical protein
MLNRSKFLPYAILVILLGIALVLTGCLSPSKRIIGTWFDDSGTKYQFFDDGTLSENALFSKSGTYTHVDSNHIKIQLDGLWGLAGAHVFQYEFDGKVLVLISDGGKVIRLSKLET